MTDAACHPSIELRDLHDRPLDRGERRDVAELHATLLPRSPVVKLGQPFMEGFYYRCLPQDGLIGGAIAYVTGRPAGFITATECPAEFMMSALRRHGPRVVAILAWTILSQPARFNAIREAKRVNRGVRRVSPRGHGELLSFGVLPEYRNSRYIAQTGLRLADVLLSQALQYLRSRGATTVRAVVDADNLEALLFYRARGWALSSGSARGWSNETVQFTLDL